MASLLAMDLAASAILATVTFTSLLSAFFLLSNDLASQLNAAQKEQKAVLISSHLIHMCWEDAGFAPCDHSDAHMTVLSTGSIGKFSDVNFTYFKEYFELREKKVSITLFQNRRQIYSFGDYFLGGVCINRLVIFEGENSIMRVCLD